MANRLLNLEQLMEYLGSIGKYTARKVANDSNAVVRLGNNTVRFDRLKIDEYLNHFNESNEN